MTCHLGMTHTNHFVSCFVIIKLSVVFMTHVDMCRGYILNEMTGRTIKLNSATYNKLVANGHIVDKQNGVLTPPSKFEHDSDGTDQDEQPLYTPTQNVKSRLSSGRVRR